MKIKFALAIGTFMVMTTGKADMILPATISVTCTFETADEQWQAIITSDKSGASVNINGKTFDMGGQLVGGTEGSAPYLQAVNNEGGFNITLSGGAFEEAFYNDGQTVTGTARGYIDLFNENRAFETSCTGTYLFD